MFLQKIVFQMRNGVLTYGEGEKRLLCLGFTKEQVTAEVLSQCNSDTARH